MSQIKTEQSTESQHAVRDRIYDLIGDSLELCRDSAQVGMSYAERTESVNEIGDNLKSIKEELLAIKKIRGSQR